MSILLLEVLRSMSGSEHVRAEAALNGMLAAKTCHWQSAQDRIAAIAVQLPTIWKASSALHAVVLAYHIGDFADLSSHASHPVIAGQRCNNSECS